MTVGTMAKRPSPAPTPAAPFNPFNSVRRRRSRTRLASSSQPHGSPSSAAMANSHAGASSSKHHHHHHHHAHHHHASNDGNISSTSSSSASAGTIPRALRLLRVLVYSLAAPNFLYSMYVQLVVLKGPGRTPLPASVNFGRDTLFLTFHANFHCTWYFCLCLLHSILALGGGRRRAGGGVRRRSYAARVVELYSHRPTAILFPLASFVGLAYYLILHYHPLNRLRAQLVPDHDEKMALLHFNPLLFIVLDSWLKDAELVAKHGTKKRRATRAIILYGMIYFSWTAFCTRFNGGHWPYPFQKSFSVVQHVAFVLLSCLFAAYLCRAGFRLHGRLDRRRRRRLAAMSDRLNHSSPSSAVTAGSSTHNTSSCCPCNSSTVNYVNSKASPSSTACGPSHTIANSGTANNVA